MTLDIRLATYRELYYGAGDQTRDDVGAPLDELLRELRARGYEITGGDRLANLETAVVKYLVESGNAI